ncbi:MAG TPA: efflux RND transporter periplasmic adaptor subunit [Planctomycetaceae bacterium]|jgi:HlyD family secretion protein|nr:efflux RND transporter periplasmic adaptor subunit [Planctomycetaceae bacterium]
MFRRWFLPAMAVALLGFGVAHALYIQKPEPESPSPVPPPTTPFGDTVAGAGIVEPNNQASTTSIISIGSQLSGVVNKVSVCIGQTVAAGDLLFDLDRRATEADVKVKQAQVVQAQQSLRELELQPRPETVPPSEALVVAAEATSRQQKDEYDRTKVAFAKGAATPENLVSAEQAYYNGLAQLAQAKANLLLLKAGAWEADKTVARAAVDTAKAQVDQDNTTLELLQVRAPVDGTILQINIRPGEYVSTSGSQALIMMGNLAPLHVRVNVDEEDIPRLKLDGPARAKIRGDVTQEEIPMSFVRIEPYVVPKVSLTGLNAERVDTRVVQVIYAIDPSHKMVKEKKVLVGQLVDVFINARQSLQSNLPRIATPTAYDR